MNHVQSKEKTEQKQPLCLFSGSRLHWTKARGLRLIREENNLKLN